LFRTAVVAAMLVAWSSFAQIRSDSVVHKLFLTGTAGASLVVAEHPLLRGGGAAPTFTLQAGGAITPFLSVSAEMHSLSRYVTRELLSSPFDLVASGADCTRCTAPPSALEPLSTTISFNSLAVRVDLSPFGETGPYVAASGGLAMSQGFPPGPRNTASPVGYAAGGQLGFRYRVNRTLELLAELGFQGQWYDHARVLQPLAHGGLRLYL
jgi:hypothetical protein